MALPQRLKVRHELLVLGDECELRDPAEAGAVVRCRRQDLESDEVREHLKSGKQVFQLGLEYDERVSFVLGEDLTVRKLRFVMWDVLYNIKWLTWFLRIVGTVPISVTRAKDAVRSVAGALSPLPTKSRPMMKACARPSGLG